MDRTSRLTITAIFVLLIILISGCEKKEGKIFLRVINAINAETDIIVKDSKNEIPVDGNYHEVSGYLETEYKLYNVVWDSVTNWTSSCILERVWISNTTVNKYFGDFERLTDDSYYTLKLEYKIEYSDPIVYSWLDEYSYAVSKIKATYYNLVFTYSDNSTLSHSPVP